MTFYKKLTQIMNSGLSRRGMVSYDERLPELARRLSKANSVLILTGFPVFRSNGPIVGETDGPSGAAAIAHALTQLNCRVTVVTDRFSVNGVKAALKIAAPKALAVCMPEDTKEDFSQYLIAVTQPDFIISIERPGKASDGHYYNLRGIVIDNGVIDTDYLFTQCREMEIPSIGIGDGGNELGIGVIRNKISDSVPFGDRIAAYEAADYTLIAGVSNWWGNGIAALLSHVTGKNLLFSAQMEQDCLKAVVNAGCLDGITHLPELTVDGISLNQHLNQLMEIHHLFNDSPSINEDNERTTRSTL